MGVSGNRTRRAGMGTTNRELQTQGGASPQKQRLGSFGKSTQDSSYLTTSPNDLSTRTVSLRASWSMGDTPKGAKPPTGESLRWEVAAPSLPGKNKVYERMAQPRTPPTEDLEELVNTLQFRMSQLKVGTKKKLFLHLDTNRSGYIDREELRTFLANMNVSLPVEQFDRFYDYVDAKGDGVIDYTEFCKSLVQQEQGDADQYFFKNSQGLSELLDLEDSQDAQTKSHLDVRKRRVKPPSYQTEGNMHGASLEFELPELYATIEKATDELPRVKHRKNKGFKAAVRVKGHTSAKKLMSMSHTSQLASILREKAHQKGHTMLKWFRWMDAANKDSIANEETELSNEEFCAFLEEKLHMEVEREQAEQLVSELGLGGREPGSVNMQSFCEEFGPKSTANAHAADTATEEQEPEADASPRVLARSRAISGRSLKRAISGQNTGASDLGAIEPLLLELAAQVQSGPTAVSHSEMMREFKQRDVQRRGSLPMAEFKRALRKAMAGTALKDIGMPDLTALTEQEELNYIDFVRACFEMGGLYGTSKGARIAPLTRYCPLDRMDPARSQSLRPDGSGAVSRSLSGGSLNNSQGTNTFRTTRRRVAGPGWSDPSVDQIYKKTDYVTAPSDDSPQYIDNRLRYRTLKTTEDLQMLTGTQVDDLGKSRHPMQNISETKMRRLQEQREKAENAVWAEDQRPLIREAGRVSLAHNLNKAYRGNLRLDTNAHERHFNDSNAAVRFQPVVDLHTLSRKTMMLSGRGNSGGEAVSRSLDTALPAIEPLPQYERLPFVGR